MTQITKHIYIIQTAVMTALLFLVGCVERDLDQAPTSLDGYVELTLDWGMQSPPPQSNRYLLYNESGTMVKEIISDLTTLQCQLPVGTYRIVMHNMGDQSVTYRGLDHYTTAEAYIPTMEKRPTLQGIQDGIIIGQPYMFYGTGQCKEFEELVVNPGEITRATLVPKQLSRELKVRLALEIQDEISSIEGLLHGVSQGVFLATGTYHPASCSVAYNAELSTNSVFMATIRLFNMLHDHQIPEGISSLEVSVLTKNGGAYRGEFDLTETLQQIINDNDGVVPIDIPVDIELNLEPYGKLSATVKSWENSGIGGGDPQPKNAN